ncbi:hypothetical protein [Sporosarcina sp. ITBMC105]
MFAIHFVENNIAVLNQVLRRIPEVNEAIRIKGRNGKVLSIEQVSDSKYFVHVEFEKIVEKSKVPGKDDRKKRR